MSSISSCRRATNRSSRCRRYSGGETPPAGLVEPVRGFGKVWRENPAVRQALGWATAPENGEQAQVVRFERGVMVFRASAGRVHLLYPDGMRADEVNPIY